MHLSRALTLTEELSLFAQLFISDYIISEQGYYKDLFSYTTNWWQKQSPKNVGNVFFLNII